MSGGHCTAPGVRAATTASPARRSPAPLEGPWTRPRHGLCKKSRFGSFHPMDLLCWASGSGPSGAVQGSVSYLAPLAWPALVGASHGKASDHRQLLRVARWEPPAWVRGCLHAAFSSCLSCAVSTFVRAPAGVRCLGRRLRRRPPPLSPGPHLPARVTRAHMQDRRLQGKD